MYWHHSVSPEWMQSRRSVLTASEIASCVSQLKRMTKAQEAGDQVFPAFASLWLEKQANTDPELDSFKAAARGHITEPYAVSDFNRNFEMNMFHWDDIVIKANNIGWSPDATNVSQDYPGSELLSVTEKSGTRLISPDGRFSIMGPSQMLEVKSYEPKAHMKRMLTDKMKLDERWQVAVAMWVVPSIVEGYIEFYSLETDYSFVHKYDRKELEEELKLITKVDELWSKNIKLIEEQFDLNDPSNNQWLTRFWTEKQINDEHLATLQTTELLRV